MNIVSSVKSLKYIHNLINGDRERLLNYPFTPQKPEFTPMPQTDKLPRVRPEQVGISPEYIEEFLTELCSKHGVNAHNMLMCRDGKVFCEASFAPYRSEIWHVSHSMCKSITSMAIGFLRAEGKLSFEEKVCDILSVKTLLSTATPVRNLTVKHLLCMSSGVDYKEIGIVLEKDWQNAFFRSTSEFEPGKKFDYNSMNTYLLSCIVTQITGQSLTEYLMPRLFEPLGIKNFKWEKSPMGIDKGGWGLYMTIEDMAKLGQLLLNKGVWEKDGEKKRVLPEEWIKEATRTHITGKGKNSVIEYGYQIWTRKADGMYQFNGMFGQYVIMLPKQNILIAMTSGAPNLANEAYALDCIYKYFAFDNKFPEQIKPENNEYKRLQYGLANLKYREPYPKKKGGFIESFENKITEKKMAKENAEYLNMLVGRAYSLENNTAGILPLILQCMNGNIAKGVKQISFTKENNEYFAKIYEAENEYTLPLVDGISHEFTLDINGEKYLCATVCRFYTNSRENVVLKLTVCLLESSSSRTICFEFDDTENNAVISFNEEPDIDSVLDKLELSENWQMDLLGLKDVGYAKYKLKNVFAPDIAAVRKK